jgi:hypothetical protein
MGLIQDQQDATDNLASNYTGEAESTMDVIKNWFKSNAIVKAIDDFGTATGLTGTDFLDFITLGANIFRIIGDVKSFLSQTASSAALDGSATALDGSAAALNEAAAALSASAGANGVGNAVGTGADIAKDVVVGSSVAGVAKSVIGRIGMSASAAIPEIETTANSAIASIGTTATSAIPAIDASVTDVVSSATGELIASNTGTMTTLSETAGTSISTALGAIMVPLAAAGIVAKGSYDEYQHKKGMAGLHGESDLTNLPVIGGLFKSGGIFDQSNAKKARDTYESNKKVIDQNTSSDDISSFKEQMKSHISNGQLDLSFAQGMNTQDFENYLTSIFGADRPAKEDRMMSSGTTLKDLTIGKGDINYYQGLMNSSGLSKKLAEGSYLTGLDDVPSDNYLANLHQGEAVLNATNANEWRAELSAGWTTSKQVELLDKLEDEINSKNNDSSNQALIETIKWAVKEINRNNNNNTSKSRTSNDYYNALYRSKSESELAFSYGN